MSASLYKPTRPSSYEHTEGWNKCGICCIPTEALRVRVIHCKKTANYSPVELSKAERSLPPWRRHHTHGLINGNVQQHSRRPLLLNRVSSLRACKLSCKSTVTEPIQNGARILKSRFNGNAVSHRMCRQQTVLSQKELILASAPHFRR